MTDNERKGLIQVVNRGWVRLGCSRPKTGRCFRGWHLSTKHLGATRE